MGFGPPPPPQQNNQDHCTLERTAKRAGPPPPPNTHTPQVPDAVKFHASRLLGGNWDPYPIEMSFNPPCMTLSHIGLARPGKAGAVSPRGGCCT
jgi:hypothetical protein